MLFNSLEFAVFLPLVFALYWAIGQSRRKAQNLLLLFASYFFYGWWDWRFLLLIGFSSAADYVIGWKMGQIENGQKRKWLLYGSVFLNLSLLGFFKYYNFFVASFADAFTLFGAPMKADRLNIILPVGISFYTFQTLSYTIDIYRNQLKPTKSALDFFAFVSFFPQLVAGPIERASNLLPQFAKKRHLHYGQAVDGLRQILWGLFKKIVIADNCALFVNDIFSNYQDQSGSTLVVGLLIFSLQVYGDFSGYSDIAIGTARLFGFNLRQNFAFPYFSRNMAEFWQRWHISLTTWIRDYLYIPLGGNRGTKGMQIRNTIIIFVACGFWHGANWTYIIWGALNAIYFIPILLSKTKKRHTGVVAQGHIFPTFKELLGMMLTFALITFSLVFFRSLNVTDAFGYIGKMLSPSLLSWPSISAPMFSPELKPTYIFILLAAFLAIEWFGRYGNHALEKLALPWPKMARWGFYYAIAITIFLFVGGHQAFVYFQF